MPIIHNELQREIERRVEIEDREYLERIAEKQQKHELRMLSRKLKIQTRAQAIVKVVKQVMLVLPMCLAITAIMILTLFRRDVPKVLEDLLS